MIFERLKRDLLHRGSAMKKVIIYAIAATFIVSLFALDSHGWRRRHYYRHHKRTQKGNTTKLQSCQASCDAKYGADGKKCKDLPLEEKISCREKGRSCRAKCWNKYR